MEMTTEQKYEILLYAVKSSYERARKHYNKKHVSTSNPNKSATAACTWIASNLDGLMKHLGIEHLPLEETE
jgi:hypothetical protein